ncbi:hypothetical protein [Afipia sp. DC4300-2b1]|uniref:hypothetical protein n=1 Tax=Afipia sp. DC4300-2b1 TaxID=2804672 RepID=UPI003CE988E9
MDISSSENCSLIGKVNDEHSTRSAYFEKEHELLKAQLRRFVEEGVQHRASMAAGWHGAARRAAALG